MKESSKFQFFFLNHMKESYILTIKTIMSCRVNLFDFQMSIGYIFDKKILQPANHLIIIKNFGHKCILGVIDDVSRKSDYSKYRMLTNFHMKLGSP